MNIKIKSAAVDSLGSSADQLQVGLEVAVQFAVEEPDCEEPPSSKSITTWARAAFSKRAGASDCTDSLQPKATEVTIRLVDKLEMTELNQVYRGKSGATNVLSFRAELPAELIEELEIGLLGDIVICHSVVIQEAKRQHKTVTDHYAHMVTHGILHLCGYDHEDDVGASQMEGLEIKILAANGINNPYR
ncbi:MAG: putative rRNA maturation factor [Arenicella sp.]|jgi:probable rRNA maturation factor